VTIRRLRWVIMAARYILPSLAMSCSCSYSVLRHPQPTGVLTGNKLFYVAVVRGTGGEMLHVIRCGDAANVILSDAMLYES
jgi:hypothetical protein